MEAVAVAETQTQRRGTSLTALSPYPCWKRMKSFQKSKTASFITLNFADDLCAYLLMVEMIKAQISGRHLFEHWKAVHNFYWPVKVKLYGCFCEHNMTGD